MYFKDIIGQEKIKQRLIHSVKINQIAHAQLFSGTEGIGKFAMALAYARYIQCTDKGENDACGKCSSCKKYNILEHPDLHFVFPIVKNEKQKKTICDDYLSEWRSFLSDHRYFTLQDWLKFLDTENAQAIIYTKESHEIIKKLSLKTYESEYKVMIIWLPEKMHVDCANALLKLIEEPYENTVFLLVSDNESQILPTIQSRSQYINMRPLETGDIANELTRRYGLESSDAQTVAHIANGNFCKALETIQLSEDNKIYFNLFIHLMRMAYGRKIKELKAWSEEVAALGREKEKSFLTYAQRMLRENFIFNIKIRSINYMNSYESEFSTRFSPFINEKNAFLLMKEFESAEYDIAGNANGKIVMFDLAIKIIMLLKQ